MSSISRMCPHSNWEKSCKEVNQELEKNKKVCQFLASLEEQIPGVGVRKVKICAVMAIVMGITNINEKIGMLGSKTAPKMWLPGMNESN